MFKIIPKIAVFWKLLPTNLFGMNQNIYPFQVKKGSKKNTKQEPDTSEYSADEMLKMMLDNEGVDPLTQTLSDNKTKTKPRVNISHFAV